MALFTVILDYLGGTYVDQVRAGSTREACIKWAKKIDIRAVYGIGKQSARVLQEEMGDPLIHSLEGMDNVWCTTALLNNKLALINIIRTETLVKHELWEPDGDHQEIRA